MQTNMQAHSKFSVTPVSRHKPSVQFGIPLVIFAGQLQLHCLGRLNPFIPCVCAFTYLSSSIFFMAALTAAMKKELLFSCKSRMWAHQYTGIHGAFSWRTRISGISVDKRGWIIYIIFPRVFLAGIHDQCRACSGSPQLWVLGIRLLW